MSASNAVAVTALDDWPSWPANKMILCGAKGAGKTHLCHVWAQDTGAEIVNATDLNLDLVDGLAALPHLVLDNAQRIAGTDDTEQALLHLYNLTGETGTTLLITADRPPSRWGIGLPDLASRVQAANLVTIKPPDDALLAALLVKLFADRQLSVTPELVSYLVGRMERSFSGAQNLVQALDQRALQDKRAVSRVLAREVLDFLADKGA